MKVCSIAIVGATGLVGSTLLSLIQEKQFKYANLYLIASANSAGKKLSLNGKDYCLEDLSDFDFTKTDIAFFCVSNELAQKYIPIANSAGNIVIDKSFFYRNHADVPLVIPEVNLETLADYRKLNIISNPNCNTIPIAVGIKPIYDAVGIKRINISTYQSVSGTGKEAVQELHEQSQQILSQQKIFPKVYSQQIAFNVLPHIDDFEENGYTREEMKMVWELKKIFSDTSLAINPTAVRVPVVCGHAAAVHIETKNKITQHEALKLLACAPGIKLVTGNFPYATPAQEASGNDAVYVGRVREDISTENGLNLWIVADNLRKGAALNALQIANHLIEKYLS